MLIDLSNSEMSFEIDEEENEVLDKNERVKIHGSGTDFNHLQDYDINSICSRVTVFGKKAA